MSSIKSKMIKQLVALMTVLIALVTVVTPMVSLAGEDRVPFNFVVSINGNPSHYTISRYRQTTNTRNTWKVQMDYSDEAKSVRSVTKFYLGVKHSPYNEQGSQMVKVILREGAYYTPAYTNASKKDVFLYARDDTTTNKNYTVTGYWDEETGVIK